VNNLVKYGLIAFVIFFVVTVPGSAADIIHKAIDGLGYLGHHLSDFVDATV
jgi:ABC-type phosphate/phosphonate transport system permease subunit